jgi:hypothetical protein
MLSRDYIVDPEDLDEEEEEDEDEWQVCERSIR